MLRTLAKQGKLPGIYIGVKFLVNIDRLREMLDEIPTSKFSQSEE